MSMAPDGERRTTRTQLTTSDRRLATGMWPWRRARSLSVRAAWLDHERYAGQRVVMRGQVRAFDADSPAGYFTLDDGPHRIGLRGESEVLRSYADQTVRVVGCLTFKPGVGIFLDIEQLAPGKH
ncbi:MAG: hypothetical protein ACTHMP_18710 [Thermomicrobiales bacterium]